MRRFRLTTAILLAAYPPACVTYHVVPDPAATLRAPQNEVKRVQVTLRTGEQVTVRSPQVQGDSLRGTWPNSVLQSVALADVATVPVKRTSIERTAGLVWLAVAAAVGVALTVAIFPLD